MIYPSPNFVSEVKNASRKNKSKGWSGGITKAFYGGTWFLNSNDSTPCKFGMRGVPELCLTDLQVQTPKKEPINLWVAQLLPPPQTLSLHPTVEATPSFKLTCCLCMNHPRKSQESDSQKLWHFSPELGRPQEKLCGNSRWRDSSKEASRQAWVLGSWFPPRQIPREWRGGLPGKSDASLGVVFTP